VCDFYIGYSLNIYEFHSSLNLKFGITSDLFYFSVGKKTMWVERCIQRSAEWLHLIGLAVTWWAVRVLVNERCIHSSYRPSPFV